MGKWETVQLGDVCTFINGDRGKNYPSSDDFRSNGIPFINAGHLNKGNIDCSNMNYITEEKYEKLGSGKVKHGDILYCLRGSLGKHAMVHNITKGAIASSLVILRPNRIDKHYLYQLLKTSLVVNQQFAANNGSSQPNLSASSVKKYVIPLPPKQVQQQIADILERSDTVIEKRKVQIKKLDLLIKSQFIQMFGDPVINQISWQLEPLCELGELNRGISKDRPRNDPKLLGGPYPLIQTGDIANSGLYLHDFKATYSDIGLKQSKMWKSGTLCITIAANIAKTSILGIDACFPDSVVGFVPNTKTNNIFIHHWFSFFQRILEAQAPESAQKNINLKILKELQVICPPISLQNQFADFVRQVEQQKSLLQQSLAKMEENYKSLMQKCFRGEIFS